MHTLVMDVVKGGRFFWPWFIVHCNGQNYVLHASTTLAMITICQGLLKLLLLIKNTLCGVEWLQINCLVKDK